MVKSEALETALNNKLLSSHEHLKKGVFSPPLYVGFTASADNDFRHAVAVRLAQAKARFGRLWKI